jgi:hypothetical protein
MTSRASIGGSGTLFEAQVGAACEIKPLAHEILRVHERLLLADRNGGRLGGS